jgi:hypothetical protein
MEFPMSPPCSSKARSCAEVRRRSSGTTLARPGRSAPASPGPGTATSSPTGWMSNGPAPGGRSPAATICCWCRRGATGSTRLRGVRRSTPTFAWSTAPGVGDSAPALPEGGRPRTCLLAFRLPSSRASFACEGFRSGGLAVATKRVSIPPVCVRVRRPTAQVSRHRIGSMRGVVHRNTKE